MKLVRPSGHSLISDANRLPSLALLAALMVSALQVHGGSGDVDTTFGTGGKVTTDFGGNREAGCSVAVQNDGTIVVAGGTYNGAHSDLALVRYAANGTLDSEFGTGGKVVEPFDTDNYFAFGVALQPDGKIVVAGGLQLVTLLRCMPNGDMDPSFGTGGRVTTPVSFQPGSHGIALQSDGKILVAGYSLQTRFSFTMARYMANGELDTGFGTNGTVISTINNRDSIINCIAVQDDGKIVVAGEGGGVLRDFAVVRYTASGAFDTGFGTGGIVTTNMSGDDACLSLALQSDGKIILGGCSDAGLTLARYTTGGALDPGFGTGGKVMGIGFGCAWGLAVQNDGKLVVNTEGTLRRFTASGAIDSTFGTGGEAVTSFSSMGITGHALALQSDGKIVVTGDTPGYDIGVLRYLSGDGPEIVVEQPAGNDVIDGSAAIDIGTVNPGGSASKTFTVKNTGNAELTLGTFTIDGTDAAYFAVDATDTTSPIPPGSSTSFIVWFVPGAAGAGLHRAAVHIVNNDGDENPFDIALSGTVPAPAIVIEQPAGLTVTDGGAEVPIGMLDPGGRSVSKSFTVRNPGQGNLTLGSFTIDGANAGYFAVDLSGTASVVPPGASTNFTVSFVPGAAGAGVYRAALHIANNDGDENPFDIALTGTVLTPLEAWRRQWFGSPGNAGAGADAADPNKNGIQNLIEYALGGDPGGSMTPIGIRPGVSVSPDGRMQLTFTQLLDRADVILTVVASDSLGGIRPPLARSTGGGPFTAIAAGSTVTETRTGTARTVTVTDRFLPGDPAHPRRFMWLRVTTP